MAAPTLNDVLAALEKLSAKIDAAAEMREGLLAWRRRSTISTVTSTAT
jgi:hypothetical protein